MRSSECGAWESEFSFCIPNSALRIGFELASLLVRVEGDVRNHLHVLFQGHDPRHLLFELFLRNERQVAIHEFIVGPESKTKFGQLRPIRQPLYAPNGSLARVFTYLGLATHYDCFFRTGLDTEAAEDAPEHVDVESGGEFLNKRIRFLARLNVYAIGRTGGRAHVTCNAPGSAVFADG